MDKHIDTVDDHVFMGVTEAMILAGEVMEEHESETLLVISLSPSGNNAVLGGDTTPEAIATLTDLLEQLTERTEESPEVLHVSS